MKPTNRPAFSPPPLHRTSPRSLPALSFPALCPRRPRIPCERSSEMEQSNTRGGQQLGSFVSLRPLSQFPARRLSHSAALLLTVARLTRFFSPLLAYIAVPIRVIVSVATPLRAPLSPPFSFCLAQPAPNASPTLHSDPPRTTTSRLLFRRPSARPRLGSEIANERLFFFGHMLL